MARKLRLEFPGAIYHVINRGNYRSWIFREEKTRAAFQGALFQACERSAWLLHAFVNRIGKTTAEARVAAKSAPWKLAVAAWLKNHSDASNRWLASALHLGVPAAASRNLTTFIRDNPARNRWWKVLESISAT